MWDIYKYFDNAYIWEARGIGNTDAEVVNQSKIDKIKFPNDASRTWFHLISIADLDLCYREHANQQSCFYLHSEAVHVSNGGSFASFKAPTG